MLTREKNKIIYLHFILSVLVILIHSINNETRFERIFSIDNGIGQFAVPLFFVISGFLYFRDIKTSQDVINKIGRRIYTVFVPFILWNLIYYVIHLILKPGNGFDIVEFTNAAINYTYNPSFWFIYQLLLLFAISPIVFIFYKKKVLLVILLLINALLIYLNIDIPFINEDAIIYFVSGALFAKLYNESKVMLIEKKNFIYTFIIAIILFAINRLILKSVNFGRLPIPCFTLSVVLVRLVVAFVIFYFYDLLFSYDKTYEFMSNSFFLYAMHYMIVKALIIMMKFVMYKFLPTSTFIYIEIIVFILSPLICVIICNSLAKLMINKIPKVYSVLTGNRK